MSLLSPADEAELDMLQARIAAEQSILSGVVASPREAWKAHAALCGLVRRGARQE